MTQVSRDLLQHILVAERVLARRYFYPGCHRMEPYYSSFPQAGLVLPNTEYLVQRVLSLPTGTAIGHDEINQICQIIRFVVTHGHVVSERCHGAAAMTYSRGIHAAYEVTGDVEG